MADDTRARLNAAALRYRSKKCRCSTCSVSLGLDLIAAAQADVAGAVEVWLNESEERSMAHHHLLDEVEAALAAPWWKPQRRRLRAALAVCRG